MAPFCAIYSTFLQRGYDQLVHDVVLQSLPVRFAMDRAGLVGADGATHAGAYDLAFLGPMPRMVIMAPSDEAELMHSVATAAAIDDRPSAFRYPRGEGFGVELPARGTPWEIGKGRLLREGGKVAILVLGTRLRDALAAADELAARGFPATVADARFMKPLDTGLLDQMVRHHEVLITIEEGAAGGFGAAVAHYLAWSGAFDKGLKFRPMTLPDKLIDHNTQAAQMIEAELTTQHIVGHALTALGIGSMHDFVAVPAQ
jgi:1-deoxy-D-xylulose-5-phosphate synthase